MEKRTYREKRLDDFSFDRFAEEVEEVVRFISRDDPALEQATLRIISDTESALTAIRASLAVDSEDTRVLSLAEMETFYLHAYMVEAGSIDRVLDYASSSAARFFGLLKGEGLIRSDAVEALEAQLVTSEQSAS